MDGSGHGYASSFNRLFNAFLGAIVHIFNHLASLSSNAGQERIAKMKINK